MCISYQNRSFVSNGVNLNTTVFFYKGYLWRSRLRKETRHSIVDAVPFLFAFFPSKQRSGRNVGGPLCCLLRDVCRKSFLPTIPAELFPPSGAITARAPGRFVQGDSKGEISGYVWGDNQLSNSLVWLDRLRHPPVIM